MRILAAYKPSAAEAAVVITAALREAKLRGADLTIAHHVELSTDTAALVTDAVSPAEPSGRRTKSGRDLAQLQDELDTLQREVELQGVRCEALLLVDGRRAGEELLELADASSVDLIVVGARRRSPVGKAILGSATQDILLGAPCPVLAVKSE